MQKKRAIRQQIENQRKQLTKDQVNSLSHAIIENLKSLYEFQNSRTIHCYVAWRHEVNTHDLIVEMLSQGRWVVVPVVDLQNHTLIHSEIKSFDELKPGAFGILEPPKELLRPVDIAEIELILVPGVAFDLHGNRIGYGGGYYDAFLRQSRAIKIGLAYEFQIVDELPTTDGDEKVDLVVTEKTIYRVNPLRNKIITVINRLEQTYGVEVWQNKKRDPLDMLIKTVLSQNTSDWNRDMAWEKLKHRFPTWEQVVQTQQQELAEAIRSAGLANQKSQRILEILQWIKQKYGRLNLDFICEMSVDEAIQTFTQLKGIGIKTMCVVLAFACGKDVFPVDTHVHRLCKRFGFVPKNASAEKTHYIMQRLVPAGKSYSFHINLLKHGRQTCKAQNPLCWKCPVFEYCEYEFKEERRAAGKGAQENM